jgi:hypothetical protein
MIDYDDESPKHSVFQETKKLAEELLKDPDFARKAVHDRNIIIQSLKADIEHKNVVFKEVEAKYNELSDTLSQTFASKSEMEVAISKMRETIKDLEKELGDQTDVLRKCQQDLLLQQQITESLWTIKLEKIAMSLGLYGLKGGLIKIILSRPFSQYFVLFLFIFLFVTTFMGWGAMFHIFFPLAPLLHFIEKFF